jgi:hypothetical protein
MSRKNQNIMPEDTAIRILDLDESLAIANGTKSPIKSGTKVAATPTAKFVTMLGTLNAVPIFFWWHIPGYWYSAYLGFWNLQF